MVFVLAAKILGTVGGLALLVTGAGDLPTAFGIGVLPLWLELLAAWITRCDPSLETRPPWRYADAAVDTVCFVLIPSFWLGLQYPVLGFDLLVFASSGLYRILRFLRYGLVAGRYFEGLPVSYTGYLWMGLVMLLRKDWIVPAMGLLYVTSFFMVWSRLKIRRAQIPRDASA